MLNTCVRWRCDERGGWGERRMGGRGRATSDGDDENIRASDEFRLVRLNDIMVEFLRLSHDDTRVLIDDGAACVHGI